MRLGAGRAKKEDDIDPAVGITILKKVGEEVEQGEPLAYVGWNEQSRFEAARSLLGEAWTIGDEPAPPRQLIIGEVR